VGKFKLSGFRNGRGSAANRRSLRERSAVKLLGKASFGSQSLVTAVATILSGGFEDDFDALV
jgi:hypothetical protein